jgi:hypothetical protein
MESLWAKAKKTSLQRLLTLHQKYPILECRKKVQRPLNTSPSAANTKCPHCSTKGVKLIRAKQYYELCEKCKAEDEGKISARSHRNAGIGALIVIIIIGVIIAGVANRFYQQGRETEKLLELGCEPEAWNQYGGVTI